MTRCKDMQELKPIKEVEEIVPIAMSRKITVESIKHLQGTETITQIHVLKEHDSIRELARLLGGAEITPAVLENAKEMKELAQKQKNTRFK